MTTKSRQIFYLSMAMIGVIVTWYFNLKFMSETGGFSLTQFVAATYANDASTSISNDLLVVVFTFFFWSYGEAKRLAMKRWWVYVVLTFGIAIAFACPLFMFMRERALASTNQSYA